MHRIRCNRTYRALFSRNYAHQRENCLNIAPLSRAQRFKQTKMPQNISIIKFNVEMLYDFLEWIHNGLIQFKDQKPRWIKTVCELTRSILLVDDGCQKMLWFYLRCDVYTYFELYGSLSINRKLCFRCLISLCIPSRCAILNYLGRFDRE